MITIYPKVQPDFNNLQKQNKIAPSKPDTKRLANFKLINPPDYVLFAGNGKGKKTEASFDEVFDRAIRDYCKPELFTEKVTNGDKELTPAEVILNRVRNATEYEEGRFEHSLTVAKKAQELAPAHNVSPEKALLAGVIHDYAKGMSNEELLQYALLNELKVTKDEITVPSKLHAPVGAHKAGEDFGITDEEILRAVRTHSLGSEDPENKPLSDLDKIIIIADNVDPWKDRKKKEKGKENIEGSLITETYKKTKDLDKVMLDYFRCKIVKALDSSKQIRQQYIDNYNYLANKANSNSGTSAS